MLRNTRIMIIPKRPPIAISVALQLVMSILLVETIATGSITVITTTVITFVIGAEKSIVYTSYTTLYSSQSIYTYTLFCVTKFQIRNTFSKRAFFKVLNLNPDFKKRLVKLLLKSSIFQSEPKMNSNRCYDFEKSYIILEIHWKMAESTNGRFYAK